MTEKRPGKKGLYIALIGVLLVVIGVLLFLLLRPRDGGGVVSAKRSRDPNANIGQYEGKSPEEVQAELDKIVEEGMFNISINSTVTMATGSDEAELRIENIEANHHLMSVEITLDDTGQVLYTSGLIEPGYHIQSVPFAVVLAKGSYPATALFTAYDMETEAPVGQAAARISITVQN